jgi:hypothetical protein
MILSYFLNIVGTTNFYNIPSNNGEMEKWRQHKGIYMAYHLVIL